MKRPALRSRVYAAATILSGVVVLGGAARFLSPRIFDGVSFSREVLDNKNQLLRLTLSGDEKYRIYTSLSDIHPQFIEAVLLLEDRYFYYHPGVNPVALVRAITDYTSDGHGAGASTITMQLARVRYGLRTRTVMGKLAQVLRAVQLELTHSKDEILEAYLNLVPYGGPIEGIGAASRIYFSKPASALSLSEALLLTVIPQSPSQRSLARGGLANNPSLVAARNRLLERWLERHPQDRKNIIDLQLPLISQKLKGLPFAAPHFVEMALRESPLPQVRTTLDHGLQNLLEEKLKTYLRRQAQFGVNNGAALIVNHETNSLVAAVGSGDFFNDDIEGQINGLESRRSPGSTLKPLVYALAFQQGLIHQKTLLRDTPIHFAAYDPENHDRRFLGPLPAQAALYASRNLPAVALSNQLKKPTFYEFLKSADLFLPRDASYYGLSPVLGGLEVSPWEMAHLYSMLVHRGSYRKIQLLQEAEEPPARALLSPESTFVILDMLTHTPRLHDSYNPHWLAQSYPVAWKTGTSHGFRDAWTAGVAGPYVVVVWVGHFDNRPNPQFQGREMAAPLFFQIVEGLANPNFAHPSWNSSAGLQLKPVKVCRVSGALPNAHCPHQEESWYQPGVSPIHKCNIHRPVLIGVKSGRRSCDEPSVANRLEVYEFWPSDLKSLFTKAGIQRVEPPEFESKCATQEASVEGVPPRIVSPTQNVSYLKSLTSSADLNTIELQAIADGEAQDLFWFVDKTFVGKTRSGEAMSYLPQAPGEHVISVVDNFGRSDHQPLKVEVVQ